MIRSRFEEYKSLWMRHTSQYADEYGTVYFAKVTPVVAPHRMSLYPRPEEVDHLISAVLKPGGPRHYCFSTESERDNFVSTFAQFAEADGSLSPVSPGPDIADPPPDATGDTSPCPGGGRRA